MPEQKPPLIVEFNGEEYEFPADATDAQISRFLKAIPASNAKEVPKAATWTAKFPNVAAAARGVVNALPAAGALVGGVMATPESVGLATVPGAALGAGIGRGARDLIAEAAGLDEPTSALSKAGRIGLDTAETGLLQAVVPGAVEAVKTPLKTLGEIADLVPRGKLGRAAKILGFDTDLKRIADQLRVAKSPAPILTRPAWQATTVAAPDAVEAPIKLKLNVEEAAAALKMRASKQYTDQQIENVIRAARELKMRFGLSSDATVADIVKKANETGRMTR